MGECFIFLLLFDLIESSSKSSNENKIKSTELDKVEEKEDFAFLKNENFIKFLLHESILESATYLKAEISNSKSSLNLIKIHPYCKFLLQDFYFNKLDKLDLELNSSYFSGNVNFVKTGNHKLTSCFDDFRKLRTFFINHKERFLKNKVRLTNETSLQPNQPNHNQIAQFNLNSKLLSLPKSKRQNRQKLISNDENPDKDKHLKGLDLVNKLLNHTNTENLNGKTLVLNKQTNLPNNYKSGPNLNDGKYLNHQELKQQLLNQILIEENNPTAITLKQVDPNPPVIDNFNLPRGCKIERNDKTFYYCSGNFTEVPKINANVSIL